MKQKIALFFILGSISFADSVTDMEDKIKGIEKEINVKNKRIKTINVETEKLKKKILETEIDIKEIKKERDKILKDIIIVTKNIEYGSQNLGVTSEEMKRKKMEFKAKIIAWNRYTKENGENLEEDSLFKKNFKDLLYGDLRSMDHIRDVEGDIQKVTKNIQEEKKKLTILRNELAQNVKKMDEKKAQQAKFIEQLKFEKSTHEKNINKLKKEKEQIENQIKQIIVARTTKDKKITTSSQAYLKLGKFIKPIEGKIVVEFGETTHKGIQSTGIEIHSFIGARVKASGGGKVIYADKFQGLGKVVMIDYGYNMIGIYGNLISIGVKLNEYVQKGKNIGILGLSVQGNPDLYYEQRFNLQPINPVSMF